MSDTVRVLVTGPESSGTRYVTRLVAAGGGDAVHRSQPNGTDWIDVLSMLEHRGSGFDSWSPPFDWAVVVVRGLLAHGRSMLSHNFDDDWDEVMARRQAALRALSPVIGHSRVVLVTYESLAETAERACLLAALGLEHGRADDVPYEDQNRKYYS